VSGLLGLQAAFQDLLLGRDEGFRAAVQDTRKAGRDVLLGVYREAYALRLIEVLVEDFPGLIGLMGAERFDALARDYVAAHPSRHPSIRWFGRGLADFIAARPMSAARAALVDMARFEWALGEAFDAADAEPVALDAMLSLPGEAWGSLKFSLLPSVRRLDLGWAAPQAWQQREAVEAGSLAIESAAVPVAWIIWRPQLETQFRSMEADEAAAIDAARNGKSFPEICELLAAGGDEEQAALRAAGLLRAWIDQGMIAGLEYEAVS